MVSNISRINEHFSVSPQLDAADIEAAAAAGYKTILNLRPDGEKPGYISGAEAARIAAEHGLDYRHIPVLVKGAMPDITPQLLTSFAKALDETPGPALAYCGTGRRAALIWALGAAESTTADEIISQCAAAGHDLSAIRPILEQRAGSGSPD
ncbi:MAG: TIGR01244 family phosphatase [Proteobacteria bacterium]|nr:TIGR01244 family phosphatase [Pseudomonadota bacterium]